ncbi:dTDP-4-dehydrorhamnose reductase family protein [Limnobacter sp.]|uniref:dTDP-4-dehydrorhamnose reductase family protein n=1 Tax=Limnobacter sp. TaxID=2003368 RepID=UPI0035134FF5
MNTPRHSSTQKVLVLGVTGMLGNAVFRLFSQSQGFETHGTARSTAGLRHFDEALRPRIHVGIDVEQQDHLVQLFSRVRPGVVINCIGLVKQLAEAGDPLAALPINALLPHRLARLASLAGARLVHVSTDCVFTGRQGLYKESDAPDALDLYGRSKLLGEVDEPNAVTLRTSIIGHELSSAHSLVGWFLAQEGCVRGFTRAVFSGLPTVELAKVIRDHVLPRTDLRGLWHVSSEPITKYDLLQLVKRAYGKAIEIVPDKKLVIDRSLDSSRFRAETGWQPANWTELVDSMCRFA